MTRGAALLLLLVPLPARGQAPAPCGDEAARLVRTVAAAIEPYRDPAAAVRAGFTPLGHDFPGMGEHWISLRRAVRDEFDASRPPILLYAWRGDEPVLVGAAFVAFRDPGEPLPGPAFLRHAWHEHSGTLEDELFAGDHREQPEADRFAVMVLHVWARPPSAGGVFDVQNWDLPFLREGRTRAAPDPAAARAVSLASSADYYRAALLRMGVPPGERDALDAMIGAARAEVSALLAGGDPAPAAQVALRDAWRRFAARIVERWPATRTEFDRLLSNPRVHLPCAG